MLPTHKSDIAAVEEIARKPAQILVPEIPKLMVWLQDGNWPVARPIANLLAGVGAAVIPHVSVVLKGDDPIWKYWCIELLVARLPRSQVLTLSEELRTLSQRPSSAEIAEEVNAAAARELSRVSG